MTARFLIPFLLLMLSACAAPLQTHYYRLADSAFRQPERTPNVYISVYLTDELKQPSLLYQDSEQTVYPAQHHLWSENLADALVQILANQLNQQPIKQVYTIHPSPKNKLPELRVMVRRFQGSYRAEVLIEGNVHFYDANGTLRNAHHFSVRQAQKGNGYSAMVEAFNQALPVVAKAVIVPPQQ